MREAVIVSTARTPIGRAPRGALNNIRPPTLAGHAIEHAVRRAGIDGPEVEDVIVGCVLTAGGAGLNLGRNAALALRGRYHVRGRWNGRGWLVRGVVGGQGGARRREARVWDAARREQHNG